VAVAAGISHTCALLSDHTVRCWGDNSLGELGQGTFTTIGTDGIPTPVAVTLSKPATALAAGSSVTYALLNDGTVWGWGANTLGQLGQGTFTIVDTGLDGIPTPGKVTGLPGAASAIASGSTHACAIVSGALWCWGVDANGELGDGVVTTSPQFGRATPVKAKGLGTVTGVAAGQGQTCVNMGGAINCWGDNSEGAVGTGSTTTTDYLTPQFVNLTTPTPLVTAIGAFFSHSCLLGSGGVVYCWGDNFDGELGNGTFNSPTPTGTPIANAPSGPVAATAIAVGGDHGCALTTAGAVYCWGENDQGELGNGTFNTTAGQDGVASPGLVSGLPHPASALAAGGAHTCALLSNGSVWCWGSDVSGQLGDNSSINNASPVQVSGW
jgi:alpha-tubulin suppressor-like RCC1 family protein